MLVARATANKESDTNWNATVGLITEAQQANEITTSGQSDLVVIAGAQLCGPYFTLHAAEELDITTHPGNTRELFN